MNFVEILSSSNERFSRKNLFLTQKYVKPLISRSLTKHVQMQKQEQKIMLTYKTKTEYMQSKWQSDLTG